jgi:cadmium resistance protein CadD (predicted permease)
MLILVYLGLKGIERLRWHILEHYEKAVMGVILVLLGVFGYVWRP